MRKNDRMKYIVVDILAARKLVDQQTEHYGWEGITDEIGWAMALTAVFVDALDHVSPSGRDY